MGLLLKLIFFPVIAVLFIIGIVGFIIQLCNETSGSVVAGLMIGIFICLLFPPLLFLVIVVCAIMGLIWLLHKMAGGIMG